ncbi:5-formyltetrahydrofolate cyclo-ligase [Candidatus Hartigia pinicola]
MRRKIRQSIRKIRQKMTTDQQKFAAHKIIHNVLLHPKITQAQHISLFFSIDGEINTQPLINTLWKKNINVYLPVLDPSNQHKLLFVSYTSDTQLVKNRFDINEPILDITQAIPSCELDIMMIPLVAFDSIGQRLGMGGGFYDRVLVNWKKKDFYPIGLAHDCQYFKSLLPVENWDISLPEVITPQKIWRW